jgi:hypothetical protein
MLNTKEVDSYITNSVKEVQDKLRKIRAAIR